MRKKPRNGKRASTTGKAQRWLVQQAASSQKTACHHERGHEPEERELEQQASVDDAFDSDWPVAHGFERGAHAVGHPVRYGAGPKVREASHGEGGEERGEERRSDEAKLADCFSDHRTVTIPYDLRVEPGTDIEGGDLRMKRCNSSNSAGLTSVILPSLLSSAPTACNRKLLRFTPLMLVSSPDRGFQSMNHYFDPLTRAAAREHHGVDPTGRLIDGQRGNTFQADGSDAF